MNPKAELLQPAYNALAQCMGVKQGEKVLIVTNHENQPIADALFHQAMELGAEPSTLLYPAGKINGEEPPAIVAEMMKHADVVLAPTVVSISHTDARRNASANGHTRIATLPGITEEVFIRGLGSDYHQIANTCERVRVELNSGKTAHLTTPSGTDLEIDIGNEAVASDGNITKPGTFSNLPDGESEVAPRSANGVLVVDRCGNIITEPTKIVFKGGYVTEIEQNASGKRFQTMLEGAAKKDGNKNAYFIAEFAIGTNPTAKVTGVILEDEKVLGTCHIAVGDNTSYPGGKNPSILHLDVILFKPTIVIDGKTIQKNGELKV
jgi:leucyl aminopeptidase (aminopeptidase T)